MLVDRFRLAWFRVNGVNGDIGHVGDFNSLGRAVVAFLEVIVVVSRPEGLGGQSCDAVYLERLQDTGLGLELQVLQRTSLHLAG